LNYLYKIQYLCKKFEFKIQYNINITMNNVKSKKSLKMKNNYKIEDKNFIIEDNNLDEVKLIKSKVKTFIDPNYTDYVRPPINSKIMKLIKSYNEISSNSDSNSDSDSSSYSDSDINRNEYNIERAIKLSLKDISGDKYEKKRELKKNEKNNNLIMRMIKQKEYRFKNLKEMLFKDTENKNKWKKILEKITLYINGISNKIELESDEFYYSNNLISQLDSTEKAYLLNIIKPIDDIKYFEYCFIMNENTIEVKKRKIMFEPILNKFKMLRKIDAEIRELENRIIEDINKFINNKKNQIKIEENDHKQLILIINSTKIVKENKEYIYSIIVDK
jgi:hypothetical protein